MPSRMSVAAAVEHAPEVAAAPPATVQKPIEEKMDALKLEIEKSIKYVMQAQIRAGNVIDANGTKIRSAADVKEIEFIESHGRQGVNIVLADGTRIPDLSLQSVKVVRGTGSSVELYSVADPALGKAGWNYFMAHSDKSKGVHNPTFVTSALDVALYAIRAANNVAVAGGTPPGVVPASVGGGLGNGAGAVSCTTPYVYWAEIAGRTLEVVNPANRAMALDAALRRHGFVPPSAAPEPIADRTQLVAWLISTYAARD